MRKVRHKNVVQFIGACTRKPNLCIVFEFMSGGSVYDYMRKVTSLCCFHLMELCLLLSPQFSLYSAATKAHSISQCIEYAHHAVCISPLLLDSLTAPRCSSIVHPN